MKIIPINLKTANEFVKKYHRHNKQVVGCRFAIGFEKDNQLVGVAICGRPVSRHLDNGKTLEVYRVCTNGLKNATSFLYSRCKRIGQLMGYEKIITYTLQAESGSSLRAIGAKIVKDVNHTKQWNDSKKVKRSIQSVTVQPKLRWDLVNTNNV